MINSNSVYEYAVVRFMPFIETREFANVGIVLIEPKEGRLIFKVSPKRFGRVTNFFEEMDKQLYKQAVESFTDELTRLQSFCRANHLRSKELIGVFRELTRQRESVMHFGNVSRVLANERAEKMLDKLYQKFVARDFVNQKYREQQMVKALRETFANELAHKYSERKLKAGIYEFTLPFVRNTSQGKRIIKPLAFDQKTAMSAAEHGLMWVNRMKALVEKNIVMPEQALIAVEPPLKPHNDFKEVYDEVTSSVEDLGINLEQFENISNIVSFARDSGDYIDSSTSWQ